MAETSWNGLTGDWTDSDWSSGVPTIADDASIAASGTYTVTIGSSDNVVANTVTLDSNDATLQIFGTLLTNELVLTEGTVEIDGTLQNATVALGDGTVTFGDSSISNFSDVIWTGGALDLGSGSAEILVTNGLTVQGAGGAPGTVTLDGSFSTLAFEDDETFSAVTVNVGSTDGEDVLEADGTLTLDATATVNLLAGSDFVELSGQGSLINDGTINAAATDGVVNTAEFTNAGTLEVGTGGSLSVQPGDVFTNSGSVIVDGSATLAIQYLAGFVNTGSVTVENGGFLGLGPTALSGGGTLTVFGTLDGSGQVLDIDSTGIASAVEIDGTVQNATVALGDGTVTFGASSISDFSDVIWTGGALDLGSGSAEILVTNGLTVQGAGGADGTVILEGSFSTLAFEDDETFSAVTIDAGSADGEDVLEADGTLTLDATATVNLLAGSDFVELSGQGSLINDGTINAAATEGIVNTTEFTNAGTLVVDNGSSLSVQPGDIFTNSGSVIVDGSATLAIQYLAGFVNTGSVTDLAGTITIGGPVTGAGTINLSGGSVLELQASATGGTISFADANDTLVLDTTDFGSTLAGFGTAGKLDLSSVGFVDGATATVAGKTLTLKDGGTTESFNLSTAPGDNTRFYVYADTAGGTEISSIPCYCPGTLIRTVAGETPIEQLAIGDQVVTAAGQVRPIRWIGRRSYTGRFAARNPDVLPVLIRAGALEDGIPKRDLLVSPLHAMFIDGVLIPASALINGQSIVTLEAVEQVEYIHLELDSHDVILAEGAPAESFVDDDSRGMFHNAAEYHSMHPNAGRSPARYCAPRVEDGETLEAIRRRIAARAMPDAAREQGRLLGQLDRVAQDRVAGWACVEGAPGAPVQLRIIDNDVVLGQITADAYREDLEKSGIGDGRHGFDFIVPGGLSPQTRHVVQVRRVEDGQHIIGSPFVVEAGLAATHVKAATPPAWKGMLDAATRTRVAGWACDAGHPDQPVALQILDNGVPIGRVLANRFRDDLRAAGFGDGRNGFELALPGGLSPLGHHVISVRFEQDGTELAGSPVVIEPATSFSAGLEEAVANAVAAVTGTAAQERVLSFMAAQLQTLQQHHADTDARREERLAFEQSQRRGDRPDTSRLGPRALVIDTVVPGAASGALLSHMRALQQLGYEVSFVAADDMAAASRASLDAMDVRVACAPYYSSVEDVLRRQSDCFEVVYLHRATAASRYLTLARAHQKRARVIYNVGDLHHVRLARQAAVEDRPDLQALAGQMRVAECTAAWSADAVITHSAGEAAFLRQAVPAAEIHEVGWDVPPCAVAVPFADRGGVAFIGDYGNAADVDAAHWLVEAVMPLVWGHNPAITCRLVGHAMPRSVRGLAGAGMVVGGDVAVLDQVRLTVAPLRFGAGLSRVAVESFAAGVPCVMSPVAAEGLALPKELRKMVGANAASLAALICRVHGHAALHAAAAASGLAMAGSRFTEASVRAALQDAVGGRRPAAKRQAAR